MPLLFKSVCQESVNWTKVLPILDYYYHQYIRLPLFSASNERIFACKHTRSHPVAPQSLRYGWTKTLQWVGLLQDPHRPDCFWCNFIVTGSPLYGYIEQRSVHALCKWVFMCIRVVFHCISMLHDTMTTVSLCAYDAYECTITPIVCCFWVLLSSVLQLPHMCA